MGNELMDNSKIPPQLIVDVTDGNTILVLGSQISIDSGMPNHQELSTMLVQTFGLNSESVSYDFEKLAQIVEANDGRTALEQAVKQFLAKHH
jgi:hypothetical protein